MLKFLFIIAIPIIAILILFLTNRKSKASKKGELGEELLRKKLDKTMSGEYYILSNLYVPLANGNTTEVDVLMLHKSGIYVFENKAYKGYITGGDSTWYQKLAKKSYPLHSPLLQNEAHIGSLARYLNLSENKFKSVVVFSDEARFAPNIMKLKNVTNTSRVDITLKPMLKDSSYFSSGELKELYNTLKPLTKVSKDVKEEHIKYVKKKKKAKDKAIRKKKAKGILIKVGVGVLFAILAILAGILLANM